MNFRWLNVGVGWLCFLIALITYVLTMEPTSSFWDCGEFIASAFKLQVGHPPGAPLFAMVGRIFALGAGGDVTKVAWMVNLLSAVASALTIAFLFWTITAIVQKLYMEQNGGKQIEWDTVKLVGALGAGLVGALAYTWSDTFWFSAVEGEVYATSSLFTAVVFWAMLRWDQVADQPKADRWIVLIAYLMGLSIGVHLLNLLTIPAIGLIYYFRKFSRDDKGVVFVTGSFLMLVFLSFLLVKNDGPQAILVPLFMLALSAGTVYMVYHFGELKSAATRQGARIYLTLGVSFLILIFIQYGIIPRTVWLAGVFEKLFTNGFGMNFGIGFYFYLAFLALVLGGGILYTMRKGHYHGSLAIWCVVVILIGYSSYGMIIIRSKADLPMDENNPEHVHALISYLNREQYGQQPLFSGPYYDAGQPKYEDGGPIYAQAYEIMRKGVKEPVETFTIRTDAKAFMESSGAGSDLYVRQRYVEVDRKPKAVYKDRTTIFPRMWSHDKNHINEYIHWGRVGKKDKPAMANNLRFFYHYQVGWMYWRYFMWNFAGRENDMQGHGEPMRGNWISGIPFIDEIHLGYPQTSIPDEYKDNKARNKYFFLPFLLGLFGFVYHFMKDRRSWFVTLMLFFFTGIAIVIFLNQNPLQPRERDYAYAGSFYAFTIWIGLGVLGLLDAAKRFTERKKLLGSLGITALSVVAVPINMAYSNWDDHNRARRYTAPAFAYNYLNSCAPNAILFTNGDNDTFPLWYLQEVEGIRTDVRVVNLSLLNTDWYVTQMKRAAYDGLPVPFSLTEPEYRQGTRDIVVFEPTPRSNQFIPVKEQMDFLRRRDGSNIGQSKYHIFMSNKFIIPVDSAKVIENGIVPPGMEHRVQPELKWEIKRGAVYKSELMVIDLLSNFNWDRPIYFAITVGDRNYLGLEKFFMQDGLAYRLVPFETKSHDDNVGEVNTDLMYDLLMNQFRFGNIEDPRLYLDETNVRMAMNFRSNFIRVATVLAGRGDKDRAIAALDKVETLLPDNIVPYNVYNLMMANVYIQLGEAEKGEQIVNRVKERSMQDIKFYEQFKDKTPVRRELDRAKYIVQQCDILLSTAGRMNFDSEFGDVDSIGQPQSP